MHYVAIVTVLAFLEFTVFGLLVGRARSRYGVAAPATSGNEMFERYFRVHVNTMEQLVVFVPTLWIFAYYGNATLAAMLGAMFIFGRIVYFRAYMRDPRSRSLGFALTQFPMVTMQMGILVYAVRVIVAGQ